MLLTLFSEWPLIRIMAICFVCIAAVPGRNEAQTATQNVISVQQWCVPDRPIRFASYNIFNNLRDAKAVLENIRSTSADVVMLQEVPDAEFESMKRSLGYEYGYFAPDITGNSGNVKANSKSRGIALLSRFPLTEAAPIPRGPGGGTKGVWAVAHVDQCKFLVASVHLSATSSANPAVVMKSVRWRSGEVRDFRTAWQERGRPPMVMGGDFNQTPMAEPYELMTAEWTDALAVLKQTGPTFINGLWRPRIDYFLSTPEWTPQSGKVVDADGSDHRAIMMTAVARKPATNPTSQPTAASKVNATVPAFPSAEGFGARASGGRGGDVYVVNNLNDSGNGSLRDGVKRGDRTVTFAVSGTIKLQSPLMVSVNNITIAGQTAPGDGIALRGHELFVRNANNVIIRYLRVRPGDEAKVAHDAITIWASNDVILDHCSMSWSTDSLNDVVKNSGNITVQWCLLSEPLNESVHLKGKHGYGTGWDGRGKGGGSFHHNLIAHSASRAPRIGYLRDAGRGLIDCRNNVIYNSGPAYGGETDDLNYVGNYYRPGPSNLRQDGKIFWVSEDSLRVWFDDNVYEGRVSSSDLSTGVGFAVPAQIPVDASPATAPATTTSTATAPTSQRSAGDNATCFVTSPFKVAPVKTQPAEEAYELVLARAGAILPRRDAVDARVLADVKNRTGKLINSQSDVGGWPELKSTPAPKDSDADGIPDTWEIQHGLDAANASDGAMIGSDGYSNLEKYLNSRDVP